MSTTDGRIERLETQVGELQRERDEIRRRLQVIEQKIEVLGLMAGLPITAVQREELVVSLVSADSFRLRGDE